MKLSTFDQYVTIENILERPRMELQELQGDIKELQAESAMCRFLNNLSKRNLSTTRHCRAQSANINPEMLPFIDETDWDQRKGMKGFSYLLVGKPVSSHSLLICRKSFSAIAIENPCLAL